MDKTIDMAREAELIYWMSNRDRTIGRWWMDAGEPGEELKAFEALVRADEREALLDLVDDYAKNNTDLKAAIRARGNT
jgi:hypothetical protein